MSAPVMTIDGRPVSSNDTFEVINPATGQVTGHAPNCSPDDLDAAMHSAHRAFAPWAADHKLRQEAMHHAAELIRQAAPELGPLFTEEQGRPLHMAIGEIAYSALWLDYYADLELPADTVVSHPGRRLEVSRRPVGVVAAITPWNGPILLAMWKIAPALAVGATMVLKPSPFTPLTTLALGQVLAEALPAGVLNVISGLDPLGANLVSHPVARKVSFTGSVPTGKAVAVAAAQDLKRVTLELGGNDAAILLEDVDISTAVDPLFGSAFMNAGQICEATKRVYVPRSRYAELLEALAERASSFKVGHGLEPDVQMGPLTTPFQRDRIEELVEDARSGGATIAAGGKRLPGDGYFFEPTIVGDIGDGTRLVDEEQFGPALPVIAYDDLDDTIDCVNASMYGLAGSVWSTDIDAARSVAKRLDTGRITVNAGAQMPLPDVPFGGVKWSGVGVENGPWGLLEYTDLQVIEAPVPAGQE